MPPPHTTWSLAVQSRSLLSRGLCCGPVDDLATLCALSSYQDYLEGILVVVSHDRAFLNNVTTDIVHLHRYVACRARRCGQAACMRASKPSWLVCAALLFIWVHSTADR